MIPHLLRPICLAAFLLTFSGTAAAQLPNLPPTIAQTYLGSSSANSLGTAVAGVGDFDGDGIPDYLIGDSDADNNGVDSGTVIIYSGATGLAIHTLHGNGAGAHFGKSACGLGDAHLGNAGGTFAVMSETTLMGGAVVVVVTVFSAPNGAVVHQIQGGGSNPLLKSEVAHGGDLNNDGIEDFLVDAGLPGGLEQVIAFSGADGSILHTITAPMSGIAFASSFDKAGDTNGDGFDDFIIGAPLDTQSDALGGTASIYSGFDGSLLHRIVTQQALAFFGYSVSGAGDVNQDGFADVIIGAPVDDITGVRIHSGLDGSLLYFIDGINQFDGFGETVDRAGDVDGDSFPDFIIGRNNDGNTLGASTGAASGSVHIFSGRDGKELVQASTATWDVGFGAQNSSVGDLNGDDIPDFIVAAPFVDTNGTDSGAVYVYHTPLFPVRRYDSDVNPGTTLDLRWTPEGGNPFTGNAYGLTGTISCTQASPGALGFIGVSSTPIDVPLSFGFPLLIANDPTNLISSGGFGFDNAGEFLAMGTSRQNPFLAGNFIYVQFFEFSPSIAASNGLRILVAP